MHRWNKNVLQDENADNDVAVGAAVTQVASPCTLRHAGHAPDEQPFAHIRRPLRLSEHKCSIAADCPPIPAVEPRHTCRPTPLIYDPRREHRTGFARASPRAGGYPFMKVYDAAAIRNVAVVGHGGCGKTQLVSAMLFGAGAVNRLGKVDEGTTVTDFDEEEIARKHTLSSSLAHAEWQKTKINVIDAPGFANFLTDAKSALRVVEGALVCVDSVAGVEVQTEKLWTEAAALNLPRIVVLNRLERERASLERTLESLHRDCAREIIPIQLPLGEERGFTGVVDLVRMKALTFAGDGKMTEGEIASG